MEEKIYKTMNSTGIGSLVLGIIILIVGLTVGIINIVNGARLIKTKSKILF